MAKKSRSFRANISRKPSSARYAGFWIRLGAAVIDVIFSVLFLGIGWVVNVYLTGERGYSLGKKLMGLRVIKENGKCPIGLADALIREVIGKFVSAILLCIGFLIIPFDEKKQGFHDKIAGTYVVYA